MAADGVELRTVKPLYHKGDNDSAYESNGGRDNIALDLGDEAIAEQKIKNDTNGDNVPKFEVEENTGFVYHLQTSVRTTYSSNSDTIWACIYVILLVLYFVYFGFAMAHEKFGDEGSIRLLVCTILFVIGLCWNFCRKRLGGKIRMPDLPWEPERKEKVLKIGYIALVVAVVLFIVIYIIAEVAINSTENLISLTGLVFFVFVFFICSRNPAQIKWRPVFWGLVIQFFFALLILRWPFGYQAFLWLGARVSEFLAYSDKGAIFVFGSTYTDHFFAFKVLTVIVFFSTAVSVLYYIGVMQFIIRYLARFMSWSMGTSPTESLNAAGNIFIGQSEAPLLIRPFLKDMTNSELHAVLTGGFATIAGSVMAAYIAIDVPANHLLSASVMSAPAALAMSKLICPETEGSKSDPKKVYNMEQGPERNVIEAASNGASQSIKLIANIAANLIAFIAVLEFVNATLDWFGSRVGLEEPDFERLTFQFICSYVFYPIAAMMGVPVGHDCRKVAELIGIKTFLNEFVAYGELSVYVNNAKNLTWYEGLNGTTTVTKMWGEVNHTGAWHYDKWDIVYEDMNITLTKGILSDRAVVISTYALCGFSNIASMGIMLGALGAMAPSRKSDLSKLVVTAMIAGNVACFMTASIAGLFYDGGK
ncbi:solute carrier family 28 member 3-like [Ylistrum balloti]|uniref:solute carrier family 28 member 3-like n=1 Tax=Ylistrum balloti TaxID=509963 RepID=UPI002905F6E1|nr:solute carrier family 28 member 3-like [Ylistrum balloti]